MKRPLIVFLCITLLLAVFTGCGEKNKNDAGKIDVVVTAFVHYDFVKQIAGDKANITMLIKPGSEIHGYEPTPGDVAKIMDCDLFVYIGGEDDVWAERILSQTSDKTEKVSFLELCTEKGENHKEHHAHDDEHVWTSPKKAKIIVRELTDILCEKDKANSEAYRAKGEAFLNELCELDESLSETVKRAEIKEILVADRFPFVHLAEDYGIEYTAAFSGCSENTEPSAAVMTALSEKIKNESIPYVFKIEFSNGKIAKNVTENTDAGILLLHSCHTVSKDDFEKGVSYVSLMKQNVENLRKAMKG